MTKKAYLIGDPLGHSVSPAMQNAAAKELGLDLTYELKPTKAADLAKVVKELNRPEVVGFNVTIPHKQAILPLLDDISAPAELIGAVNTVVNEDGQLVGYNTDGASTLR